MGLIYVFLALVPALAVCEDTTPIPDRKVCYTDLGCFENKAPFDNAQGRVPKSPEQIGTVFRLFTRLNRTDGQDLLYNDSTSFASSDFNSSNPTKFIVHGFGGRLSNKWMVAIKDALLDTGDFNVVLVGWARGAAFPDYEQAVANTRLVGAEIKAVVNEMVAEGLNLNDVHLIGHSLGAQTSGTAGKLLNGQVGRITGLDPARPSYEFLHEDVRLDAKDAKFVDIIHTNSEAEPEGQRYGYGVHQESGTVDFYVNGGRKQPGCHDIYVSSILGSLVGKRRSLADLFACSHGRSHQYFLESIKSQCTFTAYKCDSYENFETGQCNSCANNACNVMGLNTDPNKALGSLYLDTNSTSPYCSQTAGPLYGSE